MYKNCGNNPILCGLNQRAGEGTKEQKGRLRRINIQQVYPLVFKEWCIQSGTAMITIMIKAVTCFEVVFLSSFLYSLLVGINGE